MWGASIVASALCALMLFAEPALAAKRVALVIGNSSYQNVVKLTNPSNDAEAMAAALKAAGFEFVDLKRGERTPAIGEPRAEARRQGRRSSLVQMLQQRQDGPEQSDLRQRERLRHARHVA
ncbi:caspase family protein [Bradyrhizobium betae]|uniref:Peptidase C14 caspase domain-containing protein n=1 Tax=Bradyrhizobium betae TaxID=244734 RepID=A0A5P6P2J8_9BRAD|nr:caspase family protein [Bradyrhizobium betae]MCS3727669.1 hypothetical protein [Bradyrhizobium betae]QFI72298.1 hypothetical protein F8237_07825 [Bradyrhizobium betae]